jgi:FkbM family methyltransferase
MVKKSGREYYSLSMDKSKYYLPISFFTPYVFLYHYGLKYFPFFSGYIENKAFLDIGAYCGDASLMFIRYNPSVIYAYEPVSRNYSLLEATVKKNLVNDKVIPLKKGLGDEKGVFYINISGSSSSLNINVQTNADMEAVEVSTLDDECEGRQIGLIKMDVEGFEYNVIKGGLKTICRDKPVMIISIYHTAKDFFEIPPMILSACPDYRFKLLDLEPSDLIDEKVLVCYPSYLTAGQ